tara:strand:+ start:234 stop:368 length:135 start_codon:yes stop_codon:yes gene_type:complete
MNKFFHNLFCQEEEYDTCGYELYNIYGNKNFIDCGKLTATFTIK